MAIRDSDYRLHIIEEKEMTLGMEIIACGMMNV